MSSNGAYVHSKHDAFGFYLVLQIYSRHQNSNFGWATGHMSPWNFQNHVSCYRYKVKLQNLTTLHEIVQQQVVIIPSPKLSVCYGPAGHCLFCVKWARIWQCKQVLFHWTNANALTCSLTFRLTETALYIDCMQNHNCNESFIF